MNNMMNNMLAISLDRFISLI